MKKSTDLEYAVALFTEGDFEDVIPFQTKEEATAYANGYSTGCSKYGGDGASFYVLPIEKEDMRTNEDITVYYAALQRYKEIYGILL